MGFLGFDPGWRRLSHCKELPCTPQTTLTGSKPSCSHLGLGKQPVVPAPLLGLTPQPMAHRGAARFAFLSSPGSNGDHLGSGDCFKASAPIISQCCPILSCRASFTHLPPVPGGAPAAQPQPFQEGAGR